MDALKKINTDLVSEASEALQNEPEKMKICPYCNKPYIWFKRGLFTGENKKILKIQVPDCKCMELKEKEQETERFLKQKSEKLQKLFDNSMITPLFKEKTFDNLSQTIEVLKCREYAKLFDPKNSKGIQMIGNVGTGKTTLLAAVCNELIENGYSCLFTTLSSLLDKFSGYSYENAGNIAPLLNWLVSFDFVVLDDIGRETYTEKRKEIAFRIIDTLLNYKTVMAFTANPEMIDKLKKIPDWKATLDRLKDICKYHFEFTGCSLRGIELYKDATITAKKEKIMNKDIKTQEKKKQAVKTQKDKTEKNTLAKETQTLLASLSYIQKQEYLDLLIADKKTVEEQIAELETALEKEM